VADEVDFLDEWSRLTGTRPERAAAAARLIRERSAVRWVGIYSVVGDEVRNEAWAGPGPPAHPNFPTDRGLTAHALRTASIVVSNDVANDPRYLTNQADTGSELIVPVVADGVVVGTLDIETDQVGGFDGELIARFEQAAATLRSLWS
jgi:GAF domain-containing protein